MNLISKSQKNILKVKNLSLEVENTTLLDSISFSLQKGGIYTLIGHNGAGKSTLIKSIFGLKNFRPDSGKIIYKGEEINSKTVTERADLGLTMTWQNPARFEGIYVKQYLELSRKDWNSDVSLNQALNLVGLSFDQYIDRKVDESLSGGERKRIELASVILTDADLIFLDEPDSGIDMDTFEKLKDLIKWFKDRGTTLFLISHNRELLKASDYSFLMCDGVIIRKGEPNEVNDYYCKHCETCKYSKMLSKKGGTHERS